MRGTLLFYHLSRPEMNPPTMVFSICLSLDYEQHQNDPGYYLVVGSDGDDDNNKRVIAL